MSDRLKSSIWGTRDSRESQATADERAQVALAWQKLADIDGNWCVANRRGQTPYTLNHTIRLATARPLSSARLQLCSKTNNRMADDKLPCSRSTSIRATNCER